MERVAQLLEDAKDASVVEKLLPGHGEDFALHVHNFGGAYGEFDEKVGAASELAYLEYVPSRAVGGGDMTPPRGGVNAPWGHKLTPVRTLDRDERAMVDASFAVLVDKLGLQAVGAPGHALVTLSNGG